LSDDVVRLRRWDESDLECVKEASTDSRIPQGTTVPPSFTTELGLAFIERQWSRADAGEGISLTVADARTNEARGLAILLVRPQPGVVGIGYWVVPRARGRGLATRAVDLLSRWALAEAGIARVEAWVEPQNTASQRVLAVAGFSREGVLRSFLTYPTGGLTLSCSHGQPTTPSLASDLRRSAPASRREGNVSVRRLHTPAPDESRSDGTLPRTIPFGADE